MPGLDGVTRPPVPVPPDPFTPANVGRDPSGGSAASARNPTGRDTAKCRKADPSPSGPASRRSTPNGRNSAAPAGTASASPSPPKDAGDELVVGEGLPAFGLDPLVARLAGQVGGDEIVEVVAAQGVLLEREVLVGAQVVDPGRRWPRRGSPAPPSESTLSGRTPAPRPLISRSSRMAGEQVQVFAVMHDPPVSRQVAVDEQPSRCSACRRLTSAVEDIADQGYSHACPVRCPDSGRRAPRRPEGAPVFSSAAAHDTSGWIRRAPA